MYDKFTPFKRIEKGINFTFNPERYEIWQNGRCIEGNVNIQLTFTQNELTKKVFVDTSENNLNLSRDLDFDISYTSGDRIYCATVPEQTNINTKDAYISFKSNVPLGFNIITRSFKNFNENEPYVCSIFLINQKIAKVSFSFENNSRLLEFYAIGVRE
jgi:hypothetical protein